MPRVARGLEPLLLVVLGLIWGSAYLAVEVGGTSVGPLTFVGLRLAIGAAFLVAVVVARRVRLPSRDRLPHVAVVALTGIVIPFSLITWSQRDIDAGLASIFNAATPLFTVGLAGLALADEPFRADRLVGLLVGFGGVIVVVGGGIDGGGSPAALGAMTLAALAYAVTAVYSRRFLRGASPVGVAASQVWIGLAITAILAVLVERPAAVLPAGETLAAALWLGVVASGIAPLLFFHLLGRWGASRTTVVNYLIPVVGVGLGGLLLGETIQPAMVIGGLVVLAGVTIATRAGSLRADRVRRARLAARPIASAVALAARAG